MIISGLYSGSNTLIPWGLSVLEFYGRRNIATHYIHVCDKENDFLQENSVNNTQHGSFHYKGKNLLTNRFMYVRLSLYVSLAKSVRKCWLTSALA